MPTMADAVNPENIPADVVVVAGYLDGSKSAWPPDAWQLFDQPKLTISTMGKLDAMAFDVEPGNAGVYGVAVAVKSRTNAGLPSVIYLRQSTLVDMTAALSGKSLTWLPVTVWPLPGPYLWACDPGVTPGTVPAWCPVKPVAVQDRLSVAPGYDLSTLFNGWTPTVGPPPPSQEELMGMTSDGNGGFFATGKGNGRTGNALHFTPSTSTPGGWSVIDITDAITQAAPTSPPYTVE